MAASRWICGQYSQTGPRAKRTGYGLLNTNRQRAKDVQIVRTKALGREVWQAKAEGQGIG